MATTIGVLNAIMRLDTKGLTTGLRKAERKFASFQKNIFSVKNALIGLGAGLAIKSVIDASIKQEQASAQLERAVRQTGMAAGFTAKQLSEYASSLQDVTTYGDETIMNMQTILLSFKQLRGEGFTRTTEAVLDMATVMGTDLKSAALQLGKALNDPIGQLGALSRTGVTFNEDQKKLIKTLAQTGRLAEAQAIILDELDTEFGKAARTARDTFGGALEGLKNAFGDLLEADGLTGAKDQIEELTRILKDPKTVEAANAFTSALIKGFRGTSKLVADSINVIRTLGTILGEEIYGTDDPLENLYIKLNKSKKEIESIVDIWNGWTPILTDKQLRKDFDAAIERFAIIAKQIQDIQDLERKFGDGPPVIVPSVSVKPIEPPKTVDERASLFALNEERQRMIKLAKEAQRVIEQTLPPHEKLINQYDELNDLLDVGFINQTQYDEAIKQTTSAYSDLFKEGDKLKDIANDLGFTFSSAFEDAIVEGGKLRDILKGLEKDILRIITRELVTKPLAGGITDFIGSAFGGGKAIGGPVRGGTSYLVGEKGPEIFTPNSSGNITPNNKIGGAAVTNNNYFTIQAPQGSISRESQSQIAASVGLATSRAIRRNT